MDDINLSSKLLLTVDYKPEQNSIKANYNELNLVTILRIEYDLKFN